MSLEHHEAASLCPECGPHEASGHTMIEPTHDPADPWTSVFRTDNRAVRGYGILDHFGERWNGRSAEDA